MAGKTKLQAIQALRAVAILLVVLLHIAGLGVHYRPEEVTTLGWAGVGHAGVDLFFVISGFIMYWIGHQQLDGWSNSGLFLYRRAARIYLPYWLWFLAALLLYLMVADVMLLAPGQITNLLQSFFLIPTWTPQLLPVSWTLKYELYFYGVCAVILLLPQQYRLIGGITWVFYMLLGQAICGPSSLQRCSQAVYLTMHPIMFEFVMGAFVGYACKKTQDPVCALPYLLPLSIAAMVSTLIGYVIFEVDLDQNPWNRVLMFGIPASLVVCGAILTERHHRLLVPSWLVKLGDASYTYYLSHLMIIQIVFFALAPIPWLPAGLIACIAFVTSFVVAHYGYRYTERPLLQLAKQQIVDCPRSTAPR